MPHSVVDVLEIIDINHQQSQRVRLPLDLIQSLFKPLQQNVSHRESCEAVVLGHMAEPRLTSTDDLGLLVDLPTKDSNPAENSHQGECNGSGANNKVGWVTVMIWKKWADDEQVNRHEGSVCRAPFRPGCDHPLCTLVSVLQAQLS